MLIKKAALFWAVWAVCLKVNIAYIKAIEGTGKTLLVPFFVWAGPAWPPPVLPEHYLTSKPCNNTACKYVSDTKKIIINIICVL